MADEEEKYMCTLFYCVYLCVCAKDTFMCGEETHNRFGVKTQMAAARMCDRDAYMEWPQFLRCRHLDIEYGSCCLVEGRSK